MMIMIIKMIQVSQMSMKLIYQHGKHSFATNLICGSGN